MRIIKSLAIVAALAPAAAQSQNAGFAVMCPMLQEAADGNGGSIPVPLANVAEIYEASGFGTDSGMYKALSGQVPLNGEMRSGIESFLADTCDGKLTLE